MTVREIRQWGDPVLRTPCDPVEAFDDTVAALGADLVETVTAVEGRAGLAANQIGVSLRAFSWFVDDRVGVVVNPTLVSVEGEQDDDEGCLSLPGLWYPLRRGQRATVSGYDVDGREITVSGTGLLARCLQHEVDHLDGALFVDRLPGRARRRAYRDAEALR